MVKRISLFVMIITVCIFAENTPVVRHEAVHTAPAATTPAPAPAVAPAPAPVPAAVEAQAAPAAEAVQPEQVAPETAPAAEPQAAAPVAPVAPAPAPAATEPAKETIIENPIEFAIVTAVFIATVLLITLTGD